MEVDGKEDGAAGCVLVGCGGVDGRVGLSVVGVDGLCCSCGA